MSENIYKYEELKKTKTFENYNTTVKEILIKIMDILVDEEVQFVIKIGKGKNETITISLESKVSSNVATLYIHKEHVRVKVLNLLDVRLDSPDYVFSGDDVMSKILKKYYELNRNRKQYSIYIYSDILEKIEATAKEENKKVNEVIEEYLQERTLDIFLNKAHKKEFHKFLESAGLINSDNSEVNYYGNKNLSLIATFYLLSAYQDHYYSTHEIKFTYDSVDETLSGPLDVIENAELFCGYEETIFLFARFLYKPELNKLSIIDLWQGIDACDQTVNHLVSIAFKIITGKYVLNHGEIVRPKKAVVTGGIL